VEWEDGDVSFSDTGLAMEHDDSGHAISLSGPAVPRGRLDGLTYLDLTMKAMCSGFIAGVRFCPIEQI
jgi:hypothetical protein